MKMNLSKDDATYLSAEDMTSSIASPCYLSAVEDPDDLDNSNNGNLDTDMINLFLQTNVRLFHFDTVNLSYVKQFRDPLLSYLDPK